MKPIVFSVTSIDQVDSRIQAIKRDDIQPTLAIVFSHLTFDLTKLGQLLAGHGMVVFGASSSGEFTHEGVFDRSITVMLLDLPRQSFQVRLFDGNIEGAAKLGHAVANWANTVSEDPALMVITAGIHANSEKIIDDIQKESRHPVPLFGGCAGLRTGTDKPLIFSETGIIDNGIIALGFDTKVVTLNGVAASGWKGIGTPKTITKAEGNVIFRIDDQPTLDMYNKYLSIGNDPTLAYEYPLLLLRDDGSSILRGSVTINDDKSITYGGAVKAGTKVRFSIPPGLEIIDRAVDVVSQLSQQVPAADAMVLFSCKGRQYTLGSLVADEISAIQKLWNAPLVGFFTDGEIGPVPNGQCELHNHTLVPVIIKERDSSGK